MKKILFCLLSVCFVVGANAQVDLKYGLLVHWGMLTFTGDPYQARTTKDYGFIPAEKFAPTGEDAAQWAKIAKDNGMTYAIMVAKHEDGFCLWPSAETDYNIAHSPCKMDVLGNFISACEAQGITPGLFYSMIDAHNEGMFRSGGPVGAPLFNLMKGEVVELVTRYPGAKILMIDVGSRLSPEQFHEVTAAVKQANPDCVIMGNQTSKWGENFGNASVLRNWFWQANGAFMPMQSILNRYHQAQAAHQPWVVNVSPDKSGRVEERQVAMLKQITDSMANSPTVSDTTSTPAAKPDPATRLKELKSMLDQGLITQDEYNKKRQEILDGM
jgi:alpha-L-fucosidase